jgi:hypothetical protein
MKEHVLQAKPQQALNPRSAAAWVEELKQPYDPALEAIRQSKMSKNKRHFSTSNPGIPVPSTDTLRF